jgi:hypothetical protein
MLGVFYLRQIVLSLYLWIWNKLMKKVYHEFMVIF